MSEPISPTTFTADLIDLHEAADVGAFLKKWHRTINTAAMVSDESVDLLYLNTALVDCVLKHLFETAKLKAYELRTSDSPEPALAVVGTGGYGRKELAPFSDVDVTFIAAHDDDPYLNAIIKDMFQSVMDVFLYGADLKVGYAYRLLGDIKQLDHQTQTSLLDSRFLCGDQELFREFRTQFRSQLLTADFVFQKWAERRAVLIKHGGDIPYLVEPNIKDGSGGLREIQNAEWMAEVIFKVGLQHLWPTVVEHKFIEEQDAIKVLAARKFLWRIRCALHVVSGDARDIMTPEKQEVIAELLHYTDSDDTPAVEFFMRDYYQHAVNGRKFSRQVIRQVLASRLPLGLGLSSVNGALLVTEPEVAECDAAFPLHLAELAQAYGLIVTDETERVVDDFLSAHPALEDPAMAGRVFTRLLTSGTSISGVLQQLEEWGALAWLLPEFGPVMNQIPYDAAHDYTVGAHSLRVVQVLESLKSESDTRLTIFRRLIGEIAFPEVLYLAALIHDVGKQWNHASHSVSGSEAAHGIGIRVGWDAERVGKLVWLVRNHLIMAETSRLRDLSLDETIREFVRQVPDMDSLNMLYLLTYADTLAVGDGVWTEVKAKFLGELYHRSETMMTDPEIGSPDAPPMLTLGPAIARQRERIRKGLTKHDLPSDIIYEHTRNLPAQYLLNTPIEEMYLHIAMISRLRETYLPIVDFTTEYGADHTELTLCTFDDAKPGLLAKITGVLYAFDINVHVAQVFTREASMRIALDTLWIDYRGKSLAAGKKTELHDALRRVLTGDMGVGELLKLKKKPFKDQTIYSATIDDKTSDRFSVLEVSCPDERGVLYRLTRTISQLGWNVHAARLSVWGSRARDAFYLTNKEGRKIPAESCEQLLSVLPVVVHNKKRIIQSTSS